MITKRKLKQLEKKIDKLLANETQETLTKWLKNKRKNETVYPHSVYPTKHS